MKKLIGLLVIGLVACGGDSSKPDPNRSRERLRYEAQLIQKCHGENMKIVMKQDWETLRAVCDDKFKEELGYTHTEARESLKLRKIPD
jgi:hypothetical protein